MFTPESVISLNDADRIRKQFNSKDYPKLASVVRLKEVGLPILPGYVIKEVTPEVLDFASKWIAESGPKGYRSDLTVQIRMTISD